MTPVLEVEDLRVAFGHGEEREVAVDDISFSIPPSGTFALLGESGCGKSVTALSVMRLLPPGARIESGNIRLGGVDLLDLPEVRMRSVRGGHMAMIFQEPMSSLNPVMTIGAQIREVLYRHGGHDRSTARARAVELLDAVRIPHPARRLEEYPHQLSGGMKQRAMIAAALAGAPDLLIADEPTTALDVTIQAQVLELLRELQREHDMAMLFITHDLAVARSMADQVAVMHSGRIVESASAEAFFAAPGHPYSRSLLSAVPNASHRAHFLGGTEQGAGESLLEVKGLRVHFPIRGGILRRVVDQVPAVDGVSFTLRAGETFALVGESGCGKTTTGKSLLRLIRPTGGRILYRGRDLAGCPARAMRRLRSEMQIVFQDPFSSLDPRMRVEDILAEGLQALTPMPAPQRRARVGELMERVGLRPAHLRRYPHEFSGGQRQRIAIARAMAVRPRLIVCDEPTSALDVTIQAQILELLCELQKHHGLSYLFITHNIGVVGCIAHRVAVMRSGRIVEQGDTQEVLAHPRDPYTRTLLSAVPQL